MVALCLCRNILSRGWGNSRKVSIYIITYYLLLIPYPLSPILVLLLAAERQLG
jgi:hypothetical protein